jgi:hypothetical protein
VIALLIPVAGSLIPTLSGAGAAKAGNQEITATGAGKIVFAT